MKKILCLLVLFIGCNSPEHHKRDGFSDAIRNYAPSPYKINNLDYMSGYEQGIEAKKKSLAIKEKLEKETIILEAKP